MNHTLALLFLFFKNARQHISNIHVTNNILAGRHKVTAKPAKKMHNTLSDIRLHFINYNKCGKDSHPDTHVRRVGGTENEW